MKLDHYISELLHEHDCVIVTDLGGFIANYKPASINPSLHVLSPPSKRIAFNSSLKNNDGLLASFIAKKSELNYSVACDVIRDYVKQATTQIKDGKRLKIENIGVLFQDSDHSLQFIPDGNMNYLVSSFGLTSIHAPVIKRPQTGELRAAVVRKSSAKKKNIRASQNKKTWKVLEVIPAAAVLSFLLLVPPMLSDLNTNLGTLLPFSRMNEYIHEFKEGDANSHTSNIQYHSPFETPSIEDEILTDSVNDEIIQPETSAHQQQFEFPSVDEANKDIQEFASSKSTVETTINSESSKQYFIIGGCFKLEENAINFISELKLKEIDAEIIGQNPGGLYMVSVFNSGSFGQTKDALTEIKSSVISSAWVYKK